MESPDERRKRALRVAANLLRGEIGALEAARVLAPYIHADPSLVSLEDRRMMIGIASETDDLPVGRAREVWHPDALLEKDKEIDKCERLYGANVRSICERMMKKWDSLSS
jgi:hypothetical protein